MQRNADGFAFVLENKDVFDKIERIKLFETMLPELYEFMNFRSRLS